MSAPAENISVFDTSFIIVAQSILSDVIMCYNITMGKIIDTNNPNYKALRKQLHGGQYNGAYYYSLDIVKNIIPNVQTDRPWDTLGMRGVRSMDHAIVFVHHNLNWDRVYSWLDQYKDQVLVCSTIPTLKWAKSKGKTAIFLPLSIDTDYVKQFKVPKTKEACYAGNRWAFKEEDFLEYVPSTTDIQPPNLEREELLRFIAPYKECYAIGRCAIEAKCLGCQIKVCYHKYQDPSWWRVLDNKDAAKILQSMLYRIDNAKNE